jgi:hypothetical protein
VVIYILLLNEGTACWRPVEAERVEGESYRILEGCPTEELARFGVMSFAASTAVLRMDLKDWSS